MRRGDWYVDTATESDFKNPLGVVDSCGWLGGDVSGRRLLCLAAGGGRHSALFASAGARVTVVDISAAALELDRKIATQRRLDIRIVEASMDNLSMLDGASFDIVIQPVSSCYTPDVTAVYRQVARVLAAGGIYVSQHKQPTNMQADAQPSARGYAVSEPYYRSGPLPAATQGVWHREAGTVEFLHRWEQLLGGLCRAGFVIEDVAEPRHANPGAEPGSHGHRSCFIPPYIKIKARRLPDPAVDSPPKLWTPG